MNGWKNLLLNDGAEKKKDEKMTRHFQFVASRCLAIKKGLNKFFQRPDIRINKTWEDLCPSAIHFFNIPAVPLVKVHMNKAAIFEC